MPDARAVASSEVREVWGLLVAPPGESSRVLRRGYSDHPLRSAADVLKDFDKTVLAHGTPVLLERATITKVTYDFLASGGPL